MEVKYELKGRMKSVKKIFGKVWYLSKENKVSDLKLCAWQDSGTLTVGEDSLEFAGKKETVTITDIQKITFGKQGRDFINNWVRIEYQNGHKAFFADGSLLGYGGILGGTKKIFNAVSHLSG